MSPSGTSLRRRSTVAAVALAGLMLVAAACGGGSKSGSSSTTTAGGSSSNNSSSNNSSPTVDVSNCSTFFKKLNDVSNQIDAAMTNSNGSIDWAGVKTALNSIKSSVPSEIKDDWNVVLAAFDTMATQLQGINLATATPDQLAQIQTTLMNIETPEFTKADANLNAYAEKHCPQLATTSTTAAN